MEEQTSNSLNQNIYCNHCGAQNGNNFKFCSNCGNSLSDYEQDNMAANIANYVFNNKEQLFSQHARQDTVQSNGQGNIQNNLQQNNNVHDNMQNQNVNQKDATASSNSKRTSTLEIVKAIAIIIGVLYLGGIVLVLILFGACIFMFV